MHNIDIDKMIQHLIINYLIIYKIKFTYSYNQIKILNQAESTFLECWFVFRKLLFEMLKNIWKNPSRTPWPFQTLYKEKNVQYWTNWSEENI